MDRPKTKAAVLFTGLTLALVFNAGCGGALAPEGALGESASELVASRYNRSVSGVKLTRDSAGRQVVSARAGLVITDTSNQTLNLSADLVVSHNGKPVGTITMPDVVKHSAITCAVTCSGACPSIFGDGVCYQCGCKYEPIFTIPWPWDPATGDLFTVKVVPARGGLAETYTADDVARYVVP